MPEPRRGDILNYFVHEKKILLIVWEIVRE